MQIILGVLSLVLTVLGLLQTWQILTIKQVQRSVDNLRNADNELGKELGGVKVLVAGQYVTRQEFSDTMREQTKTILSAVEKIEQRMSR